MPTPALWPQRPARRASA